VPFISAEDESSKNGTLEFNIAAVNVDVDDTSTFFPVTVEFVAQQGICGVEVR
jgi:hypothetical protein